MQRQTSIIDIVKTVISIISLYFQALLHYEEGLRLLNQALAIDIPKEGNEDEDLIKAHKTRAKMCRTRQQIVFRIHELKSKLNKEKLSSAPPSYDEVQLQGTT